MTVSFSADYLDKYVNQTNLSRPVNEVINEPQKEGKKGLSKGVKVVVGAGLTALAAVGIYIASKGRVKANNFQQELQQAFRRAKVHTFEDEINTKFINEQIENIRKLPLEEQLPALKNLQRYKTEGHILRLQDLNNKDRLAQGLSITRPSRRGVEASDGVMNLVNEGRYVEAGKLFEEETLKLSNFYKPSKSGNTVQETITNVLGKDSKIKPHTYDLAQEADEFVVYQNLGGYHERFIGKNGVRWEYHGIDDLSNNLSRSITEGNRPGSLWTCGKGFNLGNGVGVVHGVRNGKYITILEMPDVSGRESGTIIQLGFSSKTNKMTPLQKDLISLGDNPEKFDKTILDKITKLGNRGKVENCDYDLMLSVIQSMAQKA